INQVSAVTVVAAAAVQANAWSPALKWLSILLTSLWVRSHATDWLPALRQVALQMVQVPPAAVHAHLLQLVMAQLQMRAAQESGCDPASDSNAESNEPSGCCADAD
ncbi:hypothetical protein V8E52_001880, partial [Russula decolorans]